MGKLAANEKEAQDNDRSKRSAATKTAEGKSSKNHVGEALRSVYQHTIDEQIPQDFLDILGKLA